MIDDTDQEYETERKVDGGNYLHRRGKISLHAFIPYEFDFDLSCLITFKLRDTENVLITPDQKTTLTDLFTGFKTRPDSTRRKWLVSVFNKKIYIQIGHARLKIPADVLVDLSIVLDDLYELYTSRLSELEHSLKSRAFSASAQYNGGFKLVRIKRGLWYHIQKFAHENQTHLTTGEWAVFGSDNYSLRVYLREKGALHSGNIVISSESDLGYTNYRSSEDEVILTWNSLPREKYNRENILSYVLSVEEVYQWLIKDLIPRVVFDANGLSRKKRLHERIWKKSEARLYNEFLSTFSINDYLCSDYRCHSLANRGINPNHYLYELAVDLQSFFHNREDVFVEAEGLAHLYEGLSVLLDAVDATSLDYLHGNLYDLSIDGDITQHKLIAAIQDKLLSIDESSESNSRIELILRCYVFLLRTNSDKLEDETVNRITYCLKGLRDSKEYMDLKLRRLESLN